MTPETIYEQRQAEQRLREAARIAASRLYPDARVSTAANVQLSEGGAFVEVIVWVPSDALGKDAA